MARHTSSLESQLRTAVRNGEPRSVQLLLSQGANPNLVGCKGVAAIHLAVGKETEKNTQCLKMLLQHGANPNIKSSEGLTPLHIAAVWGCSQNLKQLLMNGGNPTIKDNEGYTPGQLAEQQENRKCAQLLQKHLASSAETERDDLPQFQYSLYSDQADVSSYPESDHSFSSHSSMISDFGEAPLSSTRRSSFFNLSNINGRPSCRGILYNRLSAVDSEMHHNQYLNSSSQWSSQGPSLLSSTRMSSVWPAIPVLKEDELFIDDVFTSKANINSAITDCRISPSRRDTLPAFLPRRTSCKSVSFCDVDEYFPVFSPETQKQQQCTSDLSFDPSEYSGFLDSERLATVLHTQGIDVTSPDHVYVFCRDSSESTEEEMEKTVVSHCDLKDSAAAAAAAADDDDDEKEVPELPAHPSGSGSGSGSGTGSSHYSSCESDHYTSALEPSRHPQHLSPPVVQHESASADGDSPAAEPQIDVSLDKLSLTEGKTSNGDVLDGRRGLGVETSSKDGVDKPDTQSDDAAESSKEQCDLPFTPSPFVTGRTRSRLSRSLRTSRTPESLLFTSSLFEDTLPTPVRTQRQTPRSQRSTDSYSSPYVCSYRQSDSGSCKGFVSSSFDHQDTQSSTLTASSSVSNSQADTLILPKSASESAGESQTLCDTVILEKGQESSLDAYERNLAEIALAMQGQGEDQCEARDFLTDDMTSSDDATTNRQLNDAFDVGGLKKQDAWISEDCTSQPESVSSSSSSAYYSPRRSREDSDLPSTPGTGCTPRYSMSRLSGYSRPQHLANLSYTPGGRPHIEDVDEPVQYLYTDTEQGHKLIETHVPPSANTSLSSSVSTASSEETIIYDWRSMQNTVQGGKENQKPQEGLKNESSDEVEDRLLQETKGLTDKQLRLRLVALGESPGPISRQTRPFYMRRLCRLLQEPQPPSPQRPSEQPQTGLGYSPELNVAMQMFKLPDCHLDEQALCQQFDQPDQNRKWREGIIKSSFNYLLLDSRVTKNLPFRSRTITQQECFQTFIHAIFYVGKGKRSRPYSHLYEALEYYKGDKTSKKLCPKVQHILQVWNAEQGVISLHCFQNVIPVEAYTREACMVEAIGLKMLTNQKRGDFYGVVSNWQQKRKRELGVHLLYRAMQIFLAEGERQLRPADIRQ